MLLDRPPKTKLALTDNAKRVLQKRYLRKDVRGRVVETPAQMLWRVARKIASVNARYGDRSTEREAREFYGIMARLEFLPNSPTLMNAGTPLQQLSACFVLPVEDSLDGIYDALKLQALIQQTGGGTGFSFSHLRPEGDVVRETGGVASGPVSFARVFDCSTDAIKQGGRRRGANMGILRYDHPDIVKFVDAKLAEGALKNFNVSVSVTDDFMRRAEHGQSFKLINPRTRKSEGVLNAERLLDRICENAWKSAEPGMVFVDRIERDNPTPKIGRLEATNPCAEQPLLPYEACNLGSINLTKCVRGSLGRARIDWKKLAYLVDTGVRFLDNVVDASVFPDRRITAVVRGNRKIGLGVMGFADALVLMGMPYDSKEALETAERIMKFVDEHAKETSIRIAEARGPFPNFSRSIYAKGDPIRNATRTTIAPTGTISMLADCSSGIEPLYSVYYTKNVLEGEHLSEINPYLVLLAKKRGFYSVKFVGSLRGRHTIRDMKGVPEDVRRLFVTAHDVTPERHVRMQAAFQKHTDNAVSKTINLPADSSARDVKNAYVLAWRLGCKGITVYREGTRLGQVITAGGVCEECGGTYATIEGAFVCKTCGDSGE
ncbi:MAG: adenosylcobalamin-dependent ribonucleoside-diphosphate reductase [Candidatus Aenigmatarchaeota archaeon]|nr:MAG: adenosylcobalamin-dependent ribonucleoside-diphosphate reductase [Candidatus Aenigmarchaeota archaeon]